MRPISLTLWTGFLLNVVRGIRVFVSCLDLTLSR